MACPAEIGLSLYRMVAMFASLINEPQIKLFIGPSNLFYVFLVLFVEFIDVSPYVFTLIAMSMLVT